MLESVNDVGDVSDVKLIVDLGHVACKGRPDLGVIHLHFHVGIYKGSDESLRLQACQSLVVQGKASHSPHDLGTFLVYLELPSTLKEVESLDNFLFSCLASHKIVIPKEHQHLIGVQVMELE